MSVVTPTATAERITLRSTRPSFFGLVRGELFKVRRQWATWVMLVLLIAVILLPYLIVLVTPNLTDRYNSDTSSFFYNMVEIGPTVLRVFSGFFLLIVTARLIGMEYRLGTIRVLLARGVGRLQLLSAKLLALALIGLGLLVLGLLLTALTVVLVVLKAGGSLDIFPSHLWSDAWTLILTILANMGITILLATAAAIIGRASAFGLAAALAFFPLDNIGTLIMQLAFFLTHNDFWLNTTAYLLGPNLNIMSHTLVDKFHELGATPLFIIGPVDVGPDTQITPGMLRETHGTLVDGTHTLVVVGVYAVIFAATAIWLMRKRDVQE